MKRFCALLLVLFFCLLFSQAASAQCGSGPLRKAAAKSRCVAGRLVCGSRRVAKSTACGACNLVTGVAGTGVCVTKAAVQTVAQPIKVVKKTICVGGQCYR